MNFLFFICYIYLLSFGKKLKKIIKLKVMEHMIERALINNMLQVYRQINNVGRHGNNLHVISNRYYNEPPLGGYEINEEHTIQDIDDIQSSILIEIISQIGTSDVKEYMKEHRRSQIKSIGKCKKIVAHSELIETVCPICIDNFKENEFYRTLKCSHSFHKRCIDHWFRKDHSDCPMCRTIIF
jgi:hypothetical protein